VAIGCIKLWLPWVSHSNPNRAALIGIGFAAQGIPHRTGLLWPPGRRLEKPLPFCEASLAAKFAGVTNTNGFGGEDTSIPYGRIELTCPPRFEG